VHGIKPPEGDEPPPPSSKGANSVKVNKRKREDGPAAKGSSSKSKSKILYRDDEPESDPDEGQLDDDDDMFVPEGDVSKKTKGLARNKPVRHQICELNGCHKRAREDDLHCSDDHEAEAAQAAFLAMLGGGAPKSTQSTESQPTKKVKVASSSVKSKGPSSVQRTSSGGSSKVLNNFRESVIKQMTNAIRKSAPMLVAKDVDVKVAEIEKAMYKLFNKQTGTPYKRKYKTLLFNFSDNKELVEKIFAGDLSSYDLVRKTAAELANSELARERELKKQDAFNQHVVASTAIEMVINEKDADRRIEQPIGSEGMRRRSPEREIAPLARSLDDSPSKPTSPTSPTFPTSPTATVTSPTSLGALGAGGAESDPDDGYEFKELAEQPEDESTTPPGSPTYNPAFVPMRVIAAVGPSAAETAAATKKIAAKRADLPAWQGEIKNSGTTVRMLSSIFGVLFL
jgi:hypothetical protein